MLKRQSTTVKVTRKIARLITRFIRMTNNGVLCRIKGEEYGVCSDLHNIPECLCVYKRTLDQISRVVDGFDTFVLTAHANKLTNPIFNGDDKYNFENVYIIDGEYWLKCHCGVTIGWFPDDPTVFEYGNGIQVLKSGRVTQIW